jgi:hypothetical protein
VDIKFSDKAVRDLCCSKRGLVLQFGADLAKRICCRLSVLASTPTLAQVPTVPPIGLAPVDAGGTYSVSLGFGHQLVFRVEASGDPTTITEIEIIGPTPVPATRGKRK